MDSTSELFAAARARRKAAIKERAEKVDLLATLLYDTVNPNQDIEIVYSKAFCIRAVERMIDLQNEFGIASSGYDLVDLLVPVFERAANQ